MLRVVNSVAPIRICDLGGWTDTWFAKHGKVLNIAVYPYVQCQMEVQKSATGKGQLTIHAENYGERYTIDPADVVYDKHPLLEAAVDAMSIPHDMDIEVSIYSSVPGGCSTGTSAAVSVAMIGALDALTPGRMTPGEIAAKAHQVETQYLGLQCGIQDQLASAYGGICFIDMTRYPDARVSRVEVPNSIWWELEQRLCLVFMGKTHRSSEVHEKVIRELEDAGPDCAKIDALRFPAVAGKDALFEGDFEGFGRAMIQNTELQRELNASLISKEAWKVIEVAKAHGAIGWKVNGAGGEGGSVTLLAGASRPARRALLRSIQALGQGIEPIFTYLSRQGVRVWE